MERGGAADEEPAIVLDSLWLLCVEWWAGDLPSTPWCHKTQKTYLNLGIHTQKKIRTRNACRGKTRLRVRRPASQADSGAKRLCILLPTPQLLPTSSSLVLCTPRVPCGPQTCSFSLPFQPLKPPFGAGKGKVDTE